MAKIMVKFSLVSMDEKDEFMCFGLQNRNKLHFQHDKVMYHLILDRLLLIKEDQQKKLTLDFKNSQLKIELKIEEYAVNIPMVVHQIKKLDNRIEMVYRVEDENEVRKICMDWMEE